MQLNEQAISNPNWKQFSHRQNKIKEIKKRMIFMLGLFLLLYIKGEDCVII